MNEFIENFNTFKNWLYTQTCDASIAKVRNKFEELNLNTAF